jgi:hypothetical protein
MDWITTKSTEMENGRWHQFQSSTPALAIHSSARRALALELARDGEIAKQSLL